MSNLVFAINISADGCCDHTAFNPGDDVLDYFTRLTREADVQLYGRKTYELMVPYWPDVAKNPAGQSPGELEFAQAFISIPRMVVFSSTLEKAEGKNTTILRGPLKDEVQNLKSGPGKMILTGGVTLPSELLELGLIDEIRLVVHPAIAGKGRRLFDGVDLQEKPRLKLLDSHIFKSGSVALRYGTRSSGPS
jgi:dihydrofolate reductase